MAGSTQQEDSSPGTKDIKVTINKALSDAQSNGLKRSEAVKSIAKALSVPRSIVYDLALQIKEW